MSFLPMKKEVSHIGMIIHSTTLDTEDKVKAIYGGKTWIQHTGYMLRGATSGVTANSAVNDGGEDSVTLTNGQLPKLSGWAGFELSNVTYGTEGMGIGSASGIISVSKSTSNRRFVSGAGVNQGSKGDISINFGNNEAHNNIPKYKSVYIWERTT